MFIIKECHISGTREDLAYAATGAKCYQTATAPHTLPGSSLAVPCAAGRDARPDLVSSFCGSPSVRIKNEI